MRQNTKLRTEEQKQEFRGDSTSREGPEKQITIKEGVLSVPRVMTYNLDHKRQVSSFANLYALNCVWQ